MKSVRKLQNKTPEEPTIVHLSAASGWRGGEQQLAYLLKELDNKSIPQILICPKDSAIQHFCQKNGITHYCFKKNAVFQIVFARAVFRLSKTTANPIFHSHDSHSHTAAYLASILFGVKSPLIVSRRVDFAIGGNQMSKRKYNAENIAKIICVSDAIKKIISPDIEKKERLLTIHSGIDIEKFNLTVKKTNLREILNADQSIRLVGNTSAISDHKDYFTFVDSAEIVLQKDDKVLFVIIGDGPMRSEIENYIAGKGLDNKILLLGFRNDIIDLLPQLDIFLFPSKTEGLGTSVLDAFAAQVPVVATITGGIPEMIIREKTGLACPVGDAQCLSLAVTRLLADPSLCDHLTKNALEKLKEFDKKNTAEKSLAVYKEIASDYFE